MSQAEELQKVFKTLADPTRVRILRLLEAEELMVQELMDVLGMAQSRVSRHLAILREASLLRDRRDGTYVFYRFAPPAERSMDSTPSTCDSVRALTTRITGYERRRVRGQDLLATEMLDLPPTSFETASYSGSRQVYRLRIVGE